MIAQLLCDARHYYWIERSNRAPNVFLLLWSIAFNRGFWTLQNHRVTNFARCPSATPTICRRLARFIQPFGEYLIAIGAKCEFQAECHLGQNVYLSRKGHIICGAHEIGSGSVIHDHCTLGDAVADGKSGRPTVGRNVWIGPNCVLAGSLTVGDGATVMPGTLLTFSVRPGTLVRGNPARIIADSFDNTVLRSSSAVPDSADSKQ